MTRQEPPSQPTAPAWSEDILWAMDAVAAAAILLDGQRRVAHANRATHALAATAIAGGTPPDLLGMLPAQAWDVAGVEGRWSGELESARGTVIATALHRGLVSGTERWFLTFHDVTARIEGRAALQERHGQLQATFQQLAGAQEQLLQSEKMASIGQLAAGVAHEINNPIGYVHSNLGALQDYIAALFAMIECSEAALRSDEPAAHREDVRNKRARLDIDFIIGDLPKLLAESREGIERVTKIVQDLKDFSHVGRGEPMRPSDLHKGLESTINIVWNDLKYKVQLEKHYGDLPLVECHQSEINQVLMNLLINAGQAIETRGTITIASGVDNDEAWISIADTGSGMSTEVMQHIFEPFYTTKPIGRGTGLGLAIAYGIATNHHGRIEVTSTPGTGSAFRLVLPVTQPRIESAAAV